jgi:V/A-type H+-transporting ATPase subunit B
MGEEGLSDTDRTYLEFGQRFEDELVCQAAPRSLEQSMDVGWRVLATLPDSELSRLSNEQIAANVRGGRRSA